MSKGKEERKKGREEENERTHFHGMLFCLCYKKMREPIENVKELCCAGFEGRKMCSNNLLAKRTHLTINVMQINLIIRLLKSIQAFSSETIFLLHGDLKSIMFGYISNSAMKFSKQF